MNPRLIATTGFLVLLLIGCAGPDQPSGGSTLPPSSSSASGGASPSTSPSVSPSTSSSPASAAPFSVLRTDGVTAQDLAEGVDIDRNGVVTALTWTDQLGANTVVLRDIGEEQADVDLFLYVDHVVQVGEEVTVLRRVTDDVTDCQVDETLGFVDQALQIRDDDGDGIGEVVFAYRLNCAGDPSASTLKVLLLENGTKYILRGSSTNQVDTRGEAPVPEPAPVTWPTGSYDFALALYAEVQPEF